MHTTPKTFAAALLAATTFLTPAASAGPTKTYRDPGFKFSVKYPAKWEQVPVETGQVLEVAKFYDPAEKGHRVSTEIEVVRVDKANAGGTGPISGKLTEEQKKELFEKAMAPDGAFEALTRFLIVPDGQKLPDKAKDFKPIQSADDVPGKLYVFEINLVGGFVPNPGQSKDYTYFAVIATYEKDGIEYGIKAMAPSRTRKKLEPEYRSIVKGFRFFDDAAKDVASIKALDEVKISPKRRLEIERNLIKGWDVKVSPKKNYVVVYNTKKGKNRELAKVIAERIEKIREKVYEVQFPSAKAIEAVSVVRVCKDLKEYYAYGGRPGTAGYWNSMREELVFFDASSSRKIDDNTVAVLYHEAFHQYIFYSVGNVAPHSWFNEGHGDYYAGAKVGASVKIEPFKWRVGVVKEAIRQGQRPKTVKKSDDGKRDVVTWGKVGYTPLKDLVAFSQPEYYAYPSVSYAQGWSLVYFLREKVPEKKEWNAKWGKILPTYFDVLKAEVNRTGELKRAGEGDGPDTPDPPDDPGGGDDPGDPDGPDDPGDGDDPDDGDEEEKDPGFQPEPEGLAPPDALKKALEEAFKGVDFEELEKAWRETISKVSG